MVNYNLHFLPYFEIFEPICLILIQKFLNKEENVNYSDSTRVGSRPKKEDYETLNMIINFRVLGSNENSKISTLLTQILIEMSGDEFCFYKKTKSDQTKSDQIQT